MPYFKQYFRPMMFSYSEIFFLKGLLPGIIILGLTFLNPNLGLSGLFSVISAYAFARFLGYQKEFLNSGYYTYNALLVGLSIGKLFSFSPLTLLFIIIAAGITFLITITFADIFHRFFLLPILSIPFVLVTSLIYLSASRFSNLYVSELYANGHIHFLSDTFPLWINGLLKTLGAIIFMPDPLVGLILLAMIFFHSRIIFILTVTGYYFGILLQGLFTGSYDLAFQDLNAFNYPLIAIALGAVFNIPTYKSYAIAMMGVAASTVFIKSIDVFWAQYNIPVFTLPFTLITLGSIYVLGLLKYPYRPLIFKDSPEETAQYFQLQKLRYASTMPFHLPFLDTWTVYQGFDGQWTHQGIWKYAYDFVKTGDNQKTYQNEGLHLSDYYCFKQPVTAPCRGYVAYVADWLPDNPIGVVDNINNWGNYVIIHDVRGYYVGICHLSQYSLTVKPGDWVEPYQIIGYCGNSGYSPEPHIHMQYQTTSMMTSYTQPFCFAGLIHSNQAQFSQYEDHTLPKVGEQVTPHFPAPFYLQLSNFVLDDTLTFEVYHQQKSIKIIQFKVKMAIDGSFYLSRKDSRLYLGKNENTFYFYTLAGHDPYLKLLYQALPSMPLNYIKQGTWQDIIPDAILGKAWSKWISDLKVLTMAQPSQNATYQFTSDTLITGEIKTPFKHTIKTQIKLDPFVKFASFKVGEYELISTNQKPKNT